MSRNINADNILRTRTPRQESYDQQIGPEPVRKPKFAKEQILKGREGLISPSKGLNSKAESTTFTKPLQA